MSKEFSFFGKIIRMLAEKDDNLMADWLPFIVYIFIPLDKLMRKVYTYHMEVIAETTSR
jgi:hypothetical protein